MAPQGRLGGEATGVTGFSAFGLYTSAFFAVILFAALAEQLGAEASHVGIGLFLLPIGLYALLGWLARPQQPAAKPEGRERLGSALITGLSAASDTLAATSFLALTGALYVLGYDGLAYALGLSGGIVLMGLLIVPFLARSGAPTVEAFIGERYGEGVPRLAAAAAIACCLFLYAVAQIYGAGLVAVRLLNIEFSTAVYLTLSGILLSAFLSGLGGTIAVQAAQYCVLLAAFLTPIVILSAKRYVLPFPELTLGQALQDLSGYEQALVSQGLASFTSLKRHISPSLSLDALNFFGIAFCFMVGMASLPHLLLRHIGAGSAVQAGRSVAWAMLFVVLLLLAAPVCAALAKLEIYTGLIGKPLRELPSWVFTYGSLEAGHPGGQALVNICGKASRSVEIVLSSCGTKHPGVLRHQDLAIDADVIALALPEIARLPLALTGLVAGAALAAAAAAAGGLLLVISQSLGNGLRKGQTDAPLARRWTGQLLLAVLAIAAALVAVSRPADILTVAGWALSLAASALFPALVLGIWWKRANAWGMIAGLVAGFGFCLFYIIGTRYFAMSFYEMWPDLSSAAFPAKAKLASLKSAYAAAAQTGDSVRIANAWSALDRHTQTMANWWGVRSSAAALFGLPVGLVAMILVSVVTPRPSPQARALVERMWRPGDAGVSSSQATR